MPCGSDAGPTLPRRLQDCPFTAARTAIPLRWNFRRIRPTYKALSRPVATQAGVAPGKPGVPILQPYLARMCSARVS